jgi:hypothetical protein
MVGWKLDLTSTVIQYAECIWRSRRRYLFVAVVGSVVPILAGCWILGLGTLFGLLLWSVLLMNELLPPTYLLLGSSQVTADGLLKHFRWFHVEKTADLLHSQSLWSSLSSLRNRDDRRWQQQLVALSAVSKLIVVDVSGAPALNLMREIQLVLESLRNQACLVGEARSRDIDAIKAIETIQEIVNGHPPFVLGKAPLCWIRKPANLLADLRKAAPSATFHDAATLRARTARWPF